jgi:hypothetical protein
MSARLSNDDLDYILAIQFSVAWAGERGSDPERLGWWQTDLIDEDTGGDLFARLLPRTKNWAGLSLARRAAVRVDASARTLVPNGDQVRSLFHFGFEIDEQLCDRVAEHRRHERLPKDALPLVFAVNYAWSKTAFAERWGRLATVKCEATSVGRRLKAKNLSAIEAARQFAAALFPLHEKYPLPSLEVLG